MVTAFDIENGTFEQQVGVLNDVTQAEQDYLKHKLISNVIENSGEAAKRKQEKATKDYTSAVEGHKRALEAQAKVQENANAGLAIPGKRC